MWSGYWIKWRIWFFKIKLSDPSELDDMMDDDAYKSYIAELD